MPQVKADLTITIKANGKSFTLNCLKLPDHSFIVKRGRKILERIPRATISEIFDTSRKWAVNNCAL
jgi:hypothetical protein